MAAAVETNVATKADAAWRTLFEKLPLRAALEQHGTATIRADQIKRLTGEEPRLMTKFDTPEARPSALKNTTVLAVKNGVYRLLAGRGYHELPAQCPVVPFLLRGRTLETLPRDCQTESQVLDYAHINGALEHFLDEQCIWLTARGRRRCKMFKFSFSTTELGPLDLIADGVQIEVDGGYEGKRIYVAEAKRGTRTHFNIRQLYYPFRMWQAEGVRKSVVPLFVCYSNRRINFYQYRFADPANFHSIELERCAAYSLDPDAPLPSVSTIIEHTHLGVEPDVPFPQADSVPRIIDVVVGVAAGVDSHADITAANDFASRQAGYYANAAQYLGLIERANARFVLTSEGQEFVRSSRSERLRRLGIAIASRPALRAVLEVLAANEGDARAAVALQRARRELGASTVSRRVQTVGRWLDWMRKTFDAPLQAS